MRHLLLIITLVVSYSFIVQQDTKTISGKWSLVCISNLLTGKQLLRPTDYNSSQLTFEFKDNGKNGIISGTTVDNHMGGGYTIKDSSKITFSNYVSTLVGEHGWGSSFQEQIQNANSFTCSQDSLLICFNDNKEVLKFIRR